MKTQRIISTCLAIAATTLLIPSPVSAADDDSVVTAQHSDIRRATVSYRDLNLVSSAGVRALRSRVRSVAIRLCTDVSAEYVYSPVDDARCANRAMTGAEPQIARAVARANNADLASTAGGTITLAMRR
jgi:UrcA family protein